MPRQYQRYDKETVQIPRLKQKLQLISQKQMKNLIPVISIILFLSISFAEASVMLNYTSCSSNCNICPDKNNCTKCKQGYYLTLDSKCLGTSVWCPECKANNKRAVCDFNNTIEKKIWKIQSVSKQFHLRSFYQPSTTVDSVWHCSYGEYWYIKKNQKTQTYSFRTFTGPDRFLKSHPNGTLYTDTQFNDQWVIYPGPEQLSTLVGKYGFLTINDDGTVKLVNKNFTLTTKSFWKLGVIW